MAYQLWALDAGAGQAVVVEDDNKWLLLSMERSWQPVELRDDSDAFHWSLRGRAVTNVQGLTDQRFESLETIVSMVSERCRVVIGAPAIVSTSRALRLCPDTLVRDRALQPWSLSQGLTSLFWHCVLAEVVGVFQSTASPSARRHRGDPLSSGFRYKDYVSLSLASIARWRLDGRTRFRSSPFAGHEGWKLQQAVVEAEEIAQRHRAASDLLPRIARSTRNEGLLHPWTSLAESMGRVARTHVEALTGGAMHADEREWDDFLADREEASERLRQLYTGVEHDLDMESRDIALLLLGGVSDDEIVTEQDIGLPQTRRARARLNGLLQSGGA